MLPISLDSIERTPSVPSDDRMEDIWGIFCKFNPKLIVFIENIFPFVFWESVE